MRNDSSIGGGGGFYKYLISPISLLLPIAAITYSFGKGSTDISHVPPIFLAGITCIYFIMAAFYVILCNNYKMRAAVAVAGLTDGVLVIFFAAAFRASVVFSLIGFSIVIAGIMTAMSMVAAPGDPLFARKIDRIVSNNVSIDELRKIIDSIQFPCIFMEKEKDGAERIIAYNEPFADDFKLDKKAILGKSLESLIPLEAGKGQMKFGGEEWVVKRTVRGKQALMMLSPILRSSEAAKIEVFDAIDPSTGLYVSGFMKYKAKSDVESVTRGKRKMSAVLFRISYPPAHGIEISEIEQKLIFAIFGRIVLQCIRACDSAYRTGNDEVLLLMPDTPHSGADIVIGRVYDTLKRSSAVECPNLSKAILDYIARDYIGGGDLPAYDRILEELSVLLYRKKPELSVGA
ncbi:MAG: hypothetical protein LBQ36_05990 [Synergistaceae bacterium]|jgi:GGDEF domain-containing protein|nr:hypothetical protein [Synergistaceae bacterium]